MGQTHAMSTVVPVYSIAKAYTAICVLRTFELDAGVGTAVAGLRPDLGMLSFGDLLSHRSGLDDYGSWSEYRAAVESRLEPWPAERILDEATIGEPGAFRYSNIGYLLLRLALEQRHGGSFHDVLTSLALDPLGIAAHRFAVRSDWEHCHHPAITDDLRAYHPGWVYTGTFAADPQEAARGLALVMQGRLGEDLAKAWRSTVLPVDAPPGHPLSPGAGYGYGVMTSGDPVRIVGHGGGGPGFSLFVAANAEGTRWRGEVAATAGEDSDLIDRCVRAVSDVS